MKKSKTQPPNFQPLFKKVLVKKPTKHLLLFCQLNNLESFVNIFVIRERFRKVCKNRILTNVDLTEKIFGFLIQNWKIYLFGWLQVNFVKLRLQIIIMIFLKKIKNGQRNIGQMNVHHNDIQSRKVELYGLKNLFNSFLRLTDLPRFMFRLSLTNYFQEKNTFNIF